MPVTTAYLDTLNSEQRRAVEHGVSELDCTSGGPLQRNLPVQAKRPIASLTS